MCNMKNQLVTILCFNIYLSYFAIYGNAQSISIPNLLSKLNIASLIAPSPPKTLPSISFKVEPAHNAASTLTPQQRLIQEHLSPLLSSLRSQPQHGNKQVLIKVPVNSGLIPPFNRARFATEEPESNAHVYVFSTSEENNASKPEELIFNYPLKQPSIEVEPQTKGVLVFVINQQPTISKDHAMLEFVPEQRNPEVQYVNYIAPHQHLYDPQQSQVHNQFWPDAHGNMHPVTMQDPHPGTGNYFTYLEQQSGIGPAMNPYNQWPIQQYSAPHRYPYAATNQSPSYSYPHGANLLTYTLPSILGRISKAPIPAEAGTEFKLKLKGLV